MWRFHGVCRRCGAAAKEGRGGGRDVKLGFPINPGQFWNRSHAGTVGLPEDVVVGINDHSRNELATAPLTLRVDAARGNAFGLPGLDARAAALETRSNAPRALDGSPASTSPADILTRPR